jgi:hypothetical protein
VTEWRAGDMVRFDGESLPCRVVLVSEPDVTGGIRVDTAEQDGDASTYCTDDAVTGERCMVEIIARGTP